MSRPLVAITGGAGHLAEYVAENLAECFEIRLLDQRHVQDNRPGEPVLLDLMDLDATVRALDGVHTVIHLAAIPHPKKDPPQRVYGINVQSTFHVLEACKRVRVPRLVFASSDSTLGFVFRERDLSPIYLPIDEDHPQRPQDPYGLSKLLGEITCKSFTEATGIITLCLRFCHVWFTKNPQPYRSLVEDPKPGIHNLWAYVDARDAAQAVRKACRVEGLDHACMYITGPNAACMEDSRELAQRYYPQVKEIRPTLQADSSFIRCEAARSLLGYAPVHSWQELLV